MLKLDSIRVNTDAERDGEYVAIPTWEGVSLGVRALTVPPYTIALDQLVQRYARRYKGKPVPHDIRDADVGALLAQHILFGWKGIDPEYSPEVAKEFLSGTSGRELAKQVLWAAGQVAEVEAEYTEDEVKN